MENDFLFLMQFILEKAEREPAATRVRIYKGMARICGDHEWQAKLESLAESVKQSAEIHSGLKFSIMKQSEGVQGDGDGDGNGDGR